MTWQQVEYYVRHMVFKFYLATFNRFSIHISVFHVLKSAENSVFRHFGKHLNSLFIAKICCFIILSLRRTECLKMWCLWHINRPCGKAETDVQTREHWVLKIIIVNLFYFFFVVVRWKTTIYNLNFFKEIV